MQLLFRKGALGVAEIVGITILIILASILIYNFKEIGATALANALSALKGG